MAALGLTPFLVSKSLFRDLNLASRIAGSVATLSSRHSSSSALPPLAQYTKLSEGTPEDFVNAQTYFSLAASPEAQSKRLLAILETLKGVNIGNKIDLFEHSIQTASRALRNGADEETVVCALFHDVGEVLTPACHGEVAASLLRPYISAENDWVLRHHEIFQAFYYGDAMNIDKNIRERFRSSPYFEACENFCEKWDQTSFDPGAKYYQSFPLAEFEPMLIRLLGKKIYSSQDLKDPVNLAKLDLNVYDFENWMKSNTG